MEVLGLVVMELLFTEVLNILGPSLPTEVYGEGGLDGANIVLQGDNNYTLYSRSST